MRHIEVVELRKTPFKSGAAISVGELVVSPSGPVGDHEFMAIDAKGNMLSQRQKAAMALISPAIGKEALSLTVSGRPSLGRAAIPHEFEPDDSKLVEAKLHDDIVVGQVVEGDAAKLLSEHLETPVTVIRRRNDYPRMIPKRYQREGFSNLTNWADVFPFMMASYISVRWVNNNTEASVSMPNIRPTIAYDFTRIPGSAADDSAEMDPFDEDYWQEIKVGEVSMLIPCPCARCAIVDVNFKEGTRDKDRSFTKVLKQHRHGFDPTKPHLTKPSDFFGSNAIHQLVSGEPSTWPTIRKGDEIRVVSRSHKRNWLPAEDDRK